MIDPQSFLGQAKLTEMERQREGAEEQRQREGAEELKACSLSCYGSLAYHGRVRRLLWIKGVVLCLLRITWVAYCTGGWVCGSVS
jgi:hypothetical protein